MRCFFLSHSALNVLRKYLISDNSYCATIDKSKVMRVIFSRKAAGLRFLPRKYKMNKRDVHTMKMLQTNVYLTDYLFTKYLHSATDRLKAPYFSYIDMQIFYHISE